MTHYEVLQVMPTASQEVIKAAYKALAIQYHPDTYESCPKYIKEYAEEFANQKMKEINEAYRVLSSPTLRQEYDRLLQYSHATQTNYQAKQAPPTPSSQPTKNETHKRKGQSKWLRWIIIILIIIAGATLVIHNYIEISLIEYVGVNIPVGNKYEITYRANPEWVSDIITWESSYERVASVSDKGVISAKNVGTTTITASIFGIKKDECKVTVYRNNDALSSTSWKSEQSSSFEYKPVETKPIAVAEPQSGTILSGAEDFYGSEITIKASSVNSCVVKLKTRYGVERLSFYVRAGDTVTVGVPDEHLYVYFASGDTWYGKSLLFGNETYYSMDDEIQDFTQYTWEYTLTPVTNGNFSETPIDASEF